MAETLETDAVVDPARTREWLLRGLQGAPVLPREGGAIDAW